MIHPVILAGGSGTRLWPVSRKAFPKQFTSLVGDQSLFQATVARFRGDQFAAPTVLTRADFRFIVAEQLDGAGVAAERILIEPVGRNTAPAILTAALALRDTPEALMLVAPSDHVIKDTETFLGAVGEAAAVARDGALVTFGISPDRAETGYGWLQRADSTDRIADLVRFVEKPAAQRAEQMLKSDRFLWNSGMFLFRVDAILQAFERHAPYLVVPCRAALAGAQDDLCFTRLAENAYARCEDISIDHAVMEKAEGMKVVPLDAGWSDLGSWRSVMNACDRDADGNALLGAASALDCRNTLLQSDDDTRLVGLGLDGIAAISAGDAVLVARVDDSERVNQVVAKLRAADIRQAEEFARCHRPWGYYETLSLGRRFQVKRICVAPGAALSLQSHVHRAEHWVVVEGSARVTVDDTVRLMAENESVYVPLGAVHRLENPGKLPLHLIEVQSGTYLGEDDIIRYEDVYDRLDAA